MSNTKRILVTGSAGRVGRAAVSALTARGHTVIGFDVRPTPGIPAAQSIVGTLTDAAVLRAAATGADCIIHLAATPDDATFPRAAPPNDTDNFLDGLVPNNVIGPYQIMEAARVLKTPRVILASTGQVVTGQLLEDKGPVPTDAPFRPRYLYACTKVFLEALGQVYSREHGIGVLMVRLGWCPRDLGQVAEIEAMELGQDVFLSPGDAGSFFAATVEVKELPPYAVVYAASNFTHRPRYDLAPSKALLGWEPRDKWPTGATAFGV